MPSQFHSAVLSHLPIVTILCACCTSYSLRYKYVLSFPKIDARQGRIRGSVRVRGGWMNIAGGIIAGIFVCCGRWFCRRLGVSRHRDEQKHCFGPSEEGFFAHRSGKWEEKFFARFPVRKICAPNMAQHLSRASAQRFGSLTTRKNAEWIMAQVPKEFGAWMHTLSQFGRAVFRRRNGTRGWE